MFIYKITNTVNGKVYVGKTTQPLDVRWKQHISDSRHKDLYFYRAIQKYGPNAFVVDELERVDSSDKLDDAERFWIKEFNSCDSAVGYNGTYGGEGGRQTEEVRQQMAIKIRVALEDPDISRRHSESISGDKNHRFGKRNSPETRAKISAALTGKKQSPETIAKRAQGQIGRKHTPEAIEKIRASRAALWANPEYREKQSRYRRGKQPMLGKKHSEESKKRMRASMLTYWQNKKAEETVPA